MRTTLMAFAALVIAGAAALSGQAPRQPATLDDLLVEIRGLRADLKRTTGTTARMQLLTARLQAQEQRIGILVSQRANVTTKLVEATRQRAQVESDFQRFEDTQAKNLPAETTREEHEAMQNVLKTSLARFRQAEQELRAQDDELSAQIAAEQNRWQDFNSRLDALERELK